MSRHRYVPMLASLTDAVPRGSGWGFEVKWDGYRTLAYLEGGSVQLLSRNGNDLTARFAPVAAALRDLPDCVLDGEVCALDADGRSSFSAMQQGAGPLVYVAFDLLEESGEALAALPLSLRRERLERLLAPAPAQVIVSEAFDDGDALLAAARAAGLEGIVAKRLASPYREGRRGGDWLKLKTGARQELVVAGYTRGAGRRSRFGALVLGVHRDGRLEWAGNVGTGFSDAEIERLLALLEPLHRQTPPFADEPRMPRVRRADVQWVEPVLVAEVAFAEWTHDGRLRQPSYLGLRDDKPTEAVVPEPPVDEVTRGSRSVRLTNRDKPFWEEEQITKGALWDYYRAIAPVLVPHLRRRPFTMRRYPDGARGKAFFQKNAPSHMPAWIRRVPVEVTARDGARGRRTIRAPVVDDELALLWMVNMGCIDMNAWLSRVDRLDRPDAILFDLDPSDGVPFDAVVEVALLVRELLDGLGLRSFPKTSSAEGMHLFVPIERRSSYAETRGFVELVAGTLARTHRGLVTTEWSKAKRRGVLIDANQNGEGRTIASVYSVRPRPGAPVATPLRWDEVTAALDPRRFTMDHVLDRVRREGDLFAEVLSLRQSPARALRSVG